MNCGHSTIIIINIIIIIIIIIIMFTFHSSCTFVLYDRTFFENQEKPLESKPVVSRKRSTIGKPALEAPITRFKPEKPVARPANVQRKIKEPQNQAYQVLTKQDVLVMSKAEPPPSRNMVREVFF